MLISKQGGLFQCSAEKIAQEQGQNDLDDRGGEEGQHAGCEPFPQVLGVDTAQVNPCKPEGSHHVVQRGTQYKADDQHRMVEGAFLTGFPGSNPLSQSCKEWQQGKGDDKAPGGAQQNADAALEPGEYGQPRNSQQQVDEGGYGAVYRSQDDPCQGKDQSLQRHGDASGERNAGDLGDHADQSREEPNPAGVGDF